MPVDPRKLLELTKESKLYWFKHHIPITQEEKRHYKCANPDGPIIVSGCPDDDPYCTCPAKELQPKDAFLLKGDSKTFVINAQGETLSSFDTYTEAIEYLDGLESDPTAEPTDEELNDYLEESKYCNLIESVLGEDYLGCDWDEPDSHFSCTCPEIGKKYKDWKKYTKTYSTFWNTPKNAPLLRNAQMSMITMQKAIAVAHGDFSLRPGMIIGVEVSMQDAEGNVELKNASGKWMIAEIEHNITGTNNHTMVLNLIRDSFYKDPNTSE